MPDHRIVLKDVNGLHHIQGTVSQTGHPVESFPLHVNNCSLAKLTDNYLLYTEDPRQLRLPFESENAL